MTPAQFVRKWEPVTLRERASVEEHFLDLRRVLDVPAEEDPTRERYTCE